MSALLADLTLQQGNVRLETLSESHIPLLVDVAADPRVWPHNHPTINTPDAFMTEWVPKTLKQQAEQSRFPFVIFVEDKVIGSTSYYYYFPKHERIAIGYTWLHPDYWRSGVNRQIKQLMIDHAFNTLQCRRVEFYIDDTNQRSCRAVEKLGAVKEGVLRQHLRRPDQTFRDTACYSILISEWSI